MRINFRAKKMITTPDWGRTVIGLHSSWPSPSSQTQGSATTTSRLLQSSLLNRSSNHQLYQYNCTCKITAKLKQMYLSAESSVTKFCSSGTISCFTLNLRIYTPQWISTSEEQVTYHCKDLSNRLLKRVAFFLSVFVQDCEFRDWNVFQIATLVVISIPNNNSFHCSHPGESGLTPDVQSLTER